MNMMIIGLCGLALLPQTVLSQTRKVSLQECINMALEKNPQMQRRFCTDFEAYEGPDKVAIHVGVVL